MLALCGIRLSLHRPIGDNFVLVGRAGGVDIEEGWVVYAGKLVDVIVSPGISRESVRLKVRTVPILGVAWLHKKITERFGVGGVVHLVVVKRGFEIIDLGLGRLELGLFAAAREFRDDDGSQDAEDDQD